MSELNNISEIVWRFRESAAAWWPTPPTGDAMRFAFCEAGEALDAVLRQNPHYMRNHAREVDLEAELAQCAIMLITALGNGYRYGSIDFVARCNVNALDEAVRFVAIAFSEFVISPNAATWRIWAECALMQIAHILGIATLGMLVDKELAKIEARCLDTSLRNAIEACQRATWR